MKEKIKYLILEDMKTFELNLLMCAIAITYFALGIIIGVKLS